MTTTSATSPTRSASARTAAAEAAVNAPEIQVKGVTRREFLYYIWGASMVLLLAQSGGALIWFMLPRFREGEFGGVFAIDAGTLPAVGAPPVLNPAGKYWLSNTEKGVLALSAVCTHLGCLYKWVEVTNRFECPCHGSKFEGDGTFIEGPAPRSLDRFELEVVAAGVATKSDADGNPVALNGATEIRINTGKKVKGPAHA
jgi:cytochrome b6-f complex iron-sulfur subunit